MSDPELIGVVLLRSLRDAEEAADLARDAAEATYNATVDAHNAAYMATRELVREASAVYVRACERSGNAHGALRDAYRKANVCTGCDAPIERCGPAMWATQRKCCPDCSHVAPPAERA